MLYLGGAAAPRNSRAGVGLLIAISYIYFLLFPLGALSNSLRVSRCISAWSQAPPHCVSTQWTRSVYHTPSYCLEDLLNQSIFLTHAFIQECPWRCARCALPQSEYLTCSNLCSWRGAQRSKCHSYGSLGFYQTVIQILFYYCHALSSSLPCI